jgi:hypothetical protein
VVTDRFELVNMAKAGQRTAMLLLVELFTDNRFGVPPLRASDNQAVFGEARETDHSFVCPLNVLWS